MQHYEHQTSFFLNEQENEAFVKYCKSKNVAPYIAGRTIVKDFMMSTEDTVEQMIINNDYEERIGVLEEEIAYLQDEIEQLNQNDRLKILEEGVDVLWDKWSELQTEVFSEAS